MPGVKEWFKGRVAAPATSSTSADPPAKRRKKAPKFSLLTVRAQAPVVKEDDDIAPQIALATLLEERNYAKAADQGGALASPMPPLVAISVARDAADPTIVTFPLDYVRVGGRDYRVAGVCAHAAGDAKHFQSYVRDARGGWTQLEDHPKQRTDRHVVAESVIINRVALVVCEEASLGAEPASDDDMFL